jgi:hypothetical protein
MDANDQLSITCVAPKAMELPDRDTGPETVVVPATDMGPVTVSRLEMAVWPSAVTRSTSTLALR